MGEMLKETKNIILLSVVFLGLMSCKKGNDDTIIGTFSATIDGTRTSFTHALEADITNLTSAYNLYIRGYKEYPGASQTSLMISVFSENMVTPATYIENSTNGPVVEMSYDRDLGSGNFFNAYAFKSNTKPVTVVVTEVNSTFVKGTFSGELMGARWDGLPLKIVIEDGKFYLRL